jgi:hypothetical protein
LLSGRRLVPVCAIENLNFKSIESHERRETGNERGREKNLLTKNSNTRPSHQTTNLLAPQKPNLLGPLLLFCSICPLINSYVLNSDVNHSRENLATHAYTNRKKVLIDSNSCQQHTIQILAHRPYLSVCVVVANQRNH